MGWVANLAHEILVTAQRTNFVFPFSDLTWDWDFGQGLGLGLINSEFNKSTENFK